MQQSADPWLSVVVPAYNEREVLDQFHQRLGSVLDSLPAGTEIVYVNDGSNDGTIGVMRRLRDLDPRVAIIDLSRNYGKEIALTAGLDFARGDAVVVIDADLQDPPELIRDLVAHWREGYDVVYGKRAARDGETWVKKVTAHYFYRFIRFVSKVQIPEDTGDFRLLSRRGVDSLKQLREQHRFMKGLFAWIGFPQKAVLYRRDPRYAGETKWNYWRLWNFAIEGITSFSIAPLKLASYVGLLTAVVAFTYGAYMLVRTLLFGNPVPGYPSLLMVILFLGGLQLLALGVIGEYLGRMFNETKQRPLYYVQECLPSSPWPPMSARAPEQARDLESSAGVGSG